MKTIKILLACVFGFLAVLVVTLTAIFLCNQAVVYGDDVAFPSWLVGLVVSIILFIVISGSLVIILVHRKIAAESERLRRREVELEETNRNLAKSREELMALNIELEEQRNWLKESEKRYRTLVESVTDYIYSVILRDGEVISKRHGAGCEAVTGYSADEFELTAGLWDGIVFAPDRKMVSEYYDRILKGQSVLPFEYRIVHKNGDVRWIKASVVSHYGRSGGLTAYDVLVSNITERKKAEQELQRSEQKFRLAFENAKDAIVWANPENGMIVDCNRATEEMLGRGRDELIGKPHTIIHPPGKAEVYVELFAQHAEGDNLQSGDYELVASDGGVIPVSLNASLTMVGDQPVIQGIFRDISAERQIRESVALRARQIEALYRIISSANKSADLDSLLDEALKTVVEVMGFDGGGIYLLDSGGRHAEIVCVTGLPDEFVDMVRRIEVSDSGYNRLFCEGVPLVSENYDMLQPERSAIGGVVSLAAVPLFSGETIIGALNVASRQRRSQLSGEIDTLVSVGRAIVTAMARMKSEISLRESEEQYRTITEQSMVGIFVLKNKNMVFANEGFVRITGFTRSEMECWDEDDFEAIIHDDDKVLFRERVLNASRVAVAEESFLRDYRILTSGGDLKWMALHFKSVMMGGEPVFVGMALDITYRKRMEQALTETNRRLRERSEELFDAIEQLKIKELDLTGANTEKEVLLKEIHHRVKNNFQVISSLLHIQLSRVKDLRATEIIRDCLNRIKSMAIVHDKLYTARNFAEVSLKDYASSLAEHLHRVYLPKEAGVKVSVTGDCVSVSISRAIPCCLILSELISNALKYAFPDREAGEVRVAFSEDDQGTVKTTITDDGVGLPENFNMNDPDSLGLQLINTFVRQIDGEIEVDAAPAVGASFVLTFRKSES